jgi:hypothetical protein
MGQGDLEERFAGYAEILPGMRTVAQREDLALSAARAGSRRRGRIRVGWHCKILQKFPDPGGFEFKGRVALVADVVEAALGLTGVDDIVRTALGAGDGEW